MRTILACLGLAALSLVPLPAQDIIVQGAAGQGLARTMNNNDNSVALTPDGAMWAVVYVVDGSGSNGHLELRRSTDQGKTWSNSYDLPNNNSHNFHHNNSGCIVAGRDGDKLHVTWADKSANALYWSAMYQVFDTVTLQWIGTPTLVARGYGANNQFWPVDIAMTPKGTVVLCISGHRSGGLGLGAWDCGLAIKTRGGTFNTPLINLRQGGAPYSQNACIVAVDETIHCCMKNNTGLYGIAYRSYDTEKQAWNQTTQVLVGPNNNANIAAGNKSVITADRSGGRYVLYVTGNATRPRTLRLAYAAPGKGNVNADWQDLQVIPDTATVGPNYRSVSSTDGAYPQIQGGNTTYRNYSLAQGGSDTVFVIYSKAFETFANLYIQSFRAGVKVLPEIKISPAGSKPYSYEWVTGMRGGDHTFTATWLTFGQTNAPSPNNGAFPNGRVTFHRASGAAVARTIAVGAGCQGKLGQRPRLHAHDSLPALGSAFKLTLDRSPANVAGFLAIGTAMLRPALALGFMGAAECELNSDFPMIVPVQVGGTGTLSLPWTVPNDNRLIGVRIYVQSLLLAPGSTAGGVVTSNGLCAVLGN